MNKDKIKILLIIAIVLPLVATAVLNQGVGGAVSKNEDDVAKTYKTKCQMCHGPTAAKHFDPTKSVEDHVAIILDGKKGEKPPFMPAYKDKDWMSPEVATALTEYMLELNPAPTPTP